MGILTKPINESIIHLAPSRYHAKEIDFFNQDPSSVGGMRYLCNTSTAGILRLMGS